MSTATTERTPPANTMDVFEAIRTRRSNGRVGPEMPPRELIVQLLDAATWAPNHKLTEPWRFFVLTGDARKRFGDAMAQVEAAKLGLAPDADDARLDRARAKALRAPVVIAVAVEPSPKVPELEEIAAGSAAVQNLLLAAHALGLGAIWRTGDVAFHPAMKEFFSLPTVAQLLGFVYVGWPETPAPPKSRQPAEAQTVWLSE